MCSMVTERNNDRCLNHNAVLLETNQKRSELYIIIIQVFNVSPQNNALCSFLFYCRSMISAFVELISNSALFINRDSSTALMYET